MSKSLLLKITCLTVLLSAISSSAKAEESRPNSWLYLAPSYNSLSVTQENLRAGSQRITARSSKAVAVRAGTILGAWGVEGVAQVANFAVQTNGSQGEQKISLARASVEARRKLYSSRRLIGGINAHVRAGYELQNVPFVGPSITAPQLARGLAHGLTIGGIVSTYFSNHWRASFGLRLLLPLSFSTNLPEAIKFSNKLNGELQLGLQYLIDPRWSIGIALSGRSSKFGHSEILSDGQPDRGVLKLSHSAILLQAGYQL